MMVQIKQQVRPKHYLSLLAIILMRMVFYVMIDLLMI